MKTKLIFLTLCILIVGACSTQKKSNRIYKRKFVLNSIDKNPLGFLYQNDTLVLSARFAECGEFGGHTEKISIFGTYKKEYFAIIVIDSIDINCPPNFEKNAIKIEDKLIKIDIKKEKAVLNYLDLLYKRSTKNKPWLHAAEYYGASKRGFELYSDEPPNSWYEFKKLRIALLK